MAGRSRHEIDPHLGSRHRIASTDRVASAGSCFAQRLTNALQDAGYNYLVTEPGPHFLSAEQKRRLGYGVYSARYGNIYSAGQLLQLFQRAYGSFATVEPLWRTPSGAYVDPFRLGIQRAGFVSEAECLADRATHLAAVRKMFETLDVLVFTLGLTEAWRSRIDGAVFSACPGSPLGGSFDPAVHEFHNFGVAEVVEHLDLFVHALAAVNPAARLVLTVSPVPLLATFEQRHVLQSTVYSKSVLRVAAEEIVRRYAHASYFASYEIVVGCGDAVGNFLEDRRTVSEAAVDHVLSCFHRQYTGFVPEPSEPVLAIDGAVADGTPLHSPMPAPSATPPAAPPSGDEPMCDEDLVFSGLADHAATQPAGD